MWCLMDRSLSPKTVAELLECKRTHVYKLVRQGLLKAEKYGPRMMRIEESELKRYKDTICQQKNGDLIVSETDSPQSEPPKMDADNALNSMLLRQKLHKMLSAPSTKKQSASRSRKN